MSLYLYAIFTIMSFSTSVASVICGIGGEVLIKPVLDAFDMLSVASIGFLSGCAVLSMGCYSVGKAKLSGESLVDLKTGTPLAIDAATGGVAGEMMFQALSNMSPDKNRVGVIQVVCLPPITSGTMLYTLKKDKMHAHHMTNPLTCIPVGLVLGICSPFLGIGGRPINSVVLFFFFSVDTKTTAQNPLYVILFSQIVSLINTLATDTVPQFSLILLALAMACGILGGVASRAVNKKIDAETVDRLFVGLMVIITLICVYNIYQFI